MKSHDEIIVENKYNELVKLLTNYFKKGREGTSNFELLHVGKYILNGLVDVVPRDYVKNYKLKKGQSLIINTDTSLNAGVHWTCLYKFDKNKYLFYDSFGRPYTTLMINSLDHLTNIIDSDLTDKEQLSKQLGDPIEQYNCGERCLGYLFICENLGYQYAKLI